MIHSGVGQEKERLAGDAGRVLREGRTSGSEQSGTSAGKGLRAAWKPG